MELFWPGRTLGDTDRIASAPIMASLTISALMSVMSPKLVARGPPEPPCPTFHFDFPRPCLMHCTLVAFPILSQMAQSHTPISRVPVLCWSPLPFSMTGASFNNGKEKRHLSEGLLPPFFLNNFDEDCRLRFGACLVPLRFPSIKGFGCRC